MALVDKIWAAIQRPSPAVTRDEIAELVATEPQAAQPPHWSGSLIRVEDVEDNIVKVPEGWALDVTGRCYRPIQPVPRRI